jgi:hypothetical protein
VHAQTQRVSALISMYSAEIERLSPRGARALRVSQLAKRSGFSLRDALIRRSDRLYMPSPRPPRALPLHCAIQPRTFSAERESCAEAVVNGIWTSGRKRARRDTPAPAPMSVFHKISHSFPFPFTILPSLPRPGRSRASREGAIDV